MITITEKLKSAIEQALKKKNPNVNDEELKQRTKTIVEKQTEVKQKSNMSVVENFNDNNKVTKEKRDEQGRLIVAENVPVFINASFNVSEENDGKD